MCPGGVPRSCSRDESTKEPSPTWRIATARIPGSSPAFYDEGMKAPRMPIRIYVCTTCKTPDDPSPERAGARLLKSLHEVTQTHQSDVIIEGVECLSVCKRPCTIAFADQNKWTYIYGDFTADDSAEQILACASLYAHAADGLIPWKERPDALKKGVIARLPASLNSSRLPEAQQ